MNLGPLRWEHGILATGPPGKSSHALFVITLSLTSCCGGMKTSPHIPGQFSHSAASDSATPWTATRQPSLSITNSWNLLKLMSIESVMPSNHLTLRHPLLLLPSIFPSIRVFSNESVLCDQYSDPPITNEKQRYRDLTLIRTLIS